MAEVSFPQGVPAERIRGEVRALQLSGSALADALEDERGAPVPLGVPGKLFLGLISISLVTLRQIFAALFFAPFALRHGGHKLPTLTRREWALIGLAGILFGAHLTVFLYSLEYTSVLAALVLTNTTPIYAALLGFFFLQERISRQVMAGVALAIVGILIVGIGGEGGAPPTRDAPLLGNALALSAAVLVALYFTVGRFIRGKLDWLTYSWLVFTIAAVFFVVAKPFLGTQILGYPLEAYLWGLLVIVLAQVMGHMSFNFALGQLSATIVSLIMMIVPALASLIAWLILGENPGLLAIVGAAVILAGLVLANLNGSRESAD